VAEKEPRTEDDLQRQLAEQLEFLEKSANDFDQGEETEAKRMAATLRILLHDTKNCRSLLGLLDMKNMSFYDTSMEDESNVQTSHCSLVHVLLTSKPPRYVALLDDTKCKKVGFDTWWNGIVFKDFDGHTISRRELITTMADQDGGSHVDQSVNKDYSKLSKGDSLKRMYSKNGKHWLDMQGAELATVRQIAHEVLKTLKANYQKKPNLPNGSLSLGGIKMVFKENTPKQVKTTKPPLRKSVEMILALVVQAKNTRNVVVRASLVSANVGCSFVLRLFSRQSDGMLVRGANYFNNITFFVSL